MRECERAAGQRDAQRALALAGADVGADQRHHRRAEAEHQRDQQVFEPRAGAVAGDRVGPACGADERGGERDRQRGLQRADRADRADAQDVGEQRPAQPRAPRSRTTQRPERMYQASTAAVSARGQRRPRGRRRRCRAAGIGPKPKISSGESGTSSDDAEADRERRHEHVAGAADHAGERVHQPDQHVAGEHHVRIGERGLERARPAPPIAA